MTYRLGGTAAACCTGHTGRVWVRLNPGESRVVSIDRY